MEDQARKLDALDKLQRADHDTLIRVEETVKSIAIDVKELNSGFIQQLAAQKAEIDLNTKAIGELKAGFNEYKTTIRVLKWVVGTLVATTAFILSTATGVRALFDR